MPIFTTSAYNLYLWGSGAAVPPAPLTSYTMYAAGLNNFGVLGDGTTVNRNSPVQIPGSWVNISLGWSSGASIGVKSDGTLWVWGCNSYYQLGTAVTQELSTGYNSTSLGTTHAVWVNSRNQAWVWGSNSYAQLGTGDTLGRLSPVLLPTSYIFASCVNNSTFFIKPDYTLWSVGYNSVGQLGDNSRVTKSSPVQVAGSWKMITTSAGSTNTVLGIQTDGTLWGWGSNDSSVLGFSGARSSPVQIGTKSDWVFVDSDGGAAGFCVVGAIDSTGILWVWGDNSNGQLGFNSLVSRSTPVQISITSSWSNVSVNSGGMVGIRSTGALFAWGFNGNGNLGIGTTISRSSPVQVGTFSWSLISSKRGGGWLGVTTTGTGYSTGYNFNYELGISDNVNRSSPVLITDSISGVVRAIGTTSGLSVVAGDDGAGTSGLNSGGLLGINNNTFTTQKTNFAGTQISSLMVLGDYQSDWGHRSSPVQIGTNTNWSWGAAGIKNMYAYGNNTLYGWGLQNYNGELGLGDRISRSSPTVIQSNYRVKSFTPTYYFSSLLKNDGTYWGTGWDAYARYGNSLTIYRSNLTQMTTKSYLVARTAWYPLFTGINFNTNFGIDTLGKLWAWGNNFDGVLGTNQNPSIDRSSPVQISAGNSFTVVDGGNAMAFAITNTGKLFAWGTYSWGGVLGTTTFRSNPTQILTGSSFTNVTAKGGIVIATQSDGTLWKWGNNTYGALGDGTSTNKSSPVAASGYAIGEGSLDGSMAYYGKKIV